MNRQDNKRKRTVVVGRECECIRLLQELPSRDCYRDSDDPYSLAFEQELMGSIELLLRTDTLACK